MQFIVQRVIQRRNPENPRTGGDQNHETTDRVLRIAVETLRLWKSQDWENQAYKEWAKQGNGTQVYVIMVDESRQRIMGDEVHDWEEVRGGLPSGGNDGHSGHCDNFVVRWRQFKVQPVLGLVTGDGFIKL